VIRLSGEYHDISSRVGRVGPSEPFCSSFISSSRYLGNLSKFKPKISSDSNRIRMNSDQHNITQRIHISKASTAKSCNLRRTS
jgi:hypothetical protein